MRRPGRPPPFGAMAGRAAAAALALLACMASGLRAEEGARAAGLLQPAMPPIPDFMRMEAETRLAEDALTCFNGQVVCISIPIAPGASESKFAYLKAREIAKVSRGMQMYTDLYDENKHFLFYDLTNLGEEAAAPPRSEAGSAPEWRVACRYWDRGDWIGERVFVIGEQRPCAA
mmetsp:Transcript_43252/g.122285  ORF Transcript_43252/g.122285 Transcript_43252/m.122285 type:complete len:174 (+) Transcript_43252:3-524(+)